VAYAMKAGQESNGASASRNGELEEPIRDLVRWLEMSWNSGASAGFATSFAEDADFINILGMHHTGRSAIEAGHRQIFDTVYKGSRVAYTLERVRFVRPEVAIAFVRARLELLAGKVLEARPTLTLSRTGERWQIVFLQNTLIADRAA
jgi:uncharacterized protein (TIGR02246 family)